MMQKSHIRFDWAIKRLLRQKANFEILEGFLSELLKEDVRIVEILDSESNKETAEDKHNRVDILVKNDKKELIIIEVQNSYALDYFLRILYGVSKAIVEHMAEGKPYSKVKKVISVNIVYFDLGHGSDYVYRGTTTFTGIHNHETLELTAAQQKMFSKEKVAEIFPEVYLIKVNNFDDRAKDTLDEWIYFLKNSEIKKEFSAKGLKKAHQVLLVGTMAKEERREYSRFMEVLSDRASIAATIEFESNLKAEAKAKTLAKTLAKTMAKTMIQEAEAKAKEAEGKAKEAEAQIREAEAQIRESEARIKESEVRIKEAEAKSFAVIENLLKLGQLSDEQIAHITGASVAVIQRMRKKQNG